jgi:hypothetical protein
VVIFDGCGSADAADEVRALAEELHAPVGYSLKGKQLLEHDNTNVVGMTGLLGYGGCWEAINHADVLLMLGTTSLSVLSCRTRRFGSSRSTADDALFFADTGTALFRTARLIEYGPNCRPFAPSPVARWPTRSPMRSVVGTNRLPKTTDHRLVRGWWLDPYQLPVNFECEAAGTDSPGSSYHTATGV